MAEKSDPVPREMAHSLDASKSAAGSENLGTHRLDTLLRHTVQDYRLALSAYEEAIDSINSNIIKYIDNGKSELPQLREFSDFNRACYSSMLSRSFEIASHFTRKYGKTIIIYEIENDVDHLQEMYSEKDRIERLSHLLHHCTRYILEILIEEKEHFDDYNVDLSRKLRAIERFAANHSEIEVAKYISLLIPHLAFSEKRTHDAAKLQNSPPPSEILPTAPGVAPVMWKDRELGETAPDFARRVYGPWLKDGMSKRVLRKLDAALVNELNRWVREGNAMPSDIKLLTVKEENDKLLQDDPSAVREHLGKFTAQEAIREVSRLRSAQQRRDKFK